jgi:hypothetical protein
VNQTEEHGPLATAHVLYATVAQLPTANVQSGAMAFATDGRKTGEGVGDGTGVPVYADTTAGSTTWRRYSDDAEVEA